MRRRVSVVIALSTAFGALLAPSANAAEFWQGVWETKNKFGKPRLILGVGLFGRAVQVEVDRFTRLVANEPVDRLVLHE